MRPDLLLVLLFSANCWHYSQSQVLSFVSNEERIYSRTLKLHIDWDQLSTKLPLQGGRYFVRLETRCWHGFCHVAQLPVNEEDSTISIKLTGDRSIDQVRLLKKWFWIFYKPINSIRLRPSPPQYSKSFKDENMRLLRQFTDSVRNFDLDGAHRVLQESELLWQQTK